MAKQLNNYTKVSIRLSSISTTQLQQLSCVYCKQSRRRNKCCSEHCDGLETWLEENGSPSMPMWSMWEMWGDRHKMDSRNSNFTGSIWSYQESRSCNRCFLHVHGMRCMVETTGMCTCRAQIQQSEICREEAKTTVFCDRFHSANALQVRIWPSRTPHWPQ